MSRIPIGGPGFQQAALSCSQDTWVEMGAANQNRNYISIQNTTAYSMYLYAGPTASATVDGSVSFAKLAAGATWTSGDHDIIMRGRIWALVVGHALTATVGEF
jgi:hypothetical protein